MEGTIWSDIPREDLVVLIKDHAALSARRAIRIEELEAAIERFREHVRSLEIRIGFAADTPIGNCSHCLVGNAPGDHHLPDCPAYKTEPKRGEV